MTPRAEGADPPPKVGKLDHVMAKERERTSGLKRATSTGVRVMGLWMFRYLVGFGATALIARALGPTGRGLYAYPVALLGLMVAIGHIGLEFAQIYLAGQGRELRRMWAVATVISLVTGALCCVALGGAVLITSRVAGGLPLSWLAISAGLVPVTLMSLYWAGLLQIDDKLMSTGWAAWFGAALQAAAVGALYALHELTPFRVLLLLVMMTCTTWLLIFMACRRARLVTVRFDRVLLRQSVAVSMKTYGAQTTFYLILRADQVLVRWYAGYRELGLYAVAATVAQMLWLLTDPFAAALIPHQLRASTGESQRLSFAMARRSLGVSLVTAVAAWVLAPLAVHIVYGSGFTGAVPALRLLLPGVVALGAAKPLRAMLLKEGRAVALSLLGFGMLGVNLALNVVLLPRIGIVGASIASSICYGALALSYVFLAWQQARRRLRDIGPLRMAFVVDTLNRGGTERQILQQASTLAALGHQVTVICLADAGRCAAGDHAGGVRIAEVGFPRLQRSLLFKPSWVRRRLLPAVRRLRAILREASPDVVHCFSRSGYLIGVPVARSVGVPVVVSSRRSLATAVRQIPLLASWERLCYRLADVVVCNSIAVMENAIVHSGMPRRKAVVIYDGIPLPTEAKRPSVETKRILIAANLIPDNGHAVALAAFAQVRLARSSVAPRLQFAGSGPAARALLAQARELGIDGEVDFLGPVADVSTLLAECSLTVLPCLTDGMPDAVLESLAHGCPVVASAVGGVPEILSRGGGILVRAGDPQALAEAMRTLLADPGLATYLGEEGRAMVHGSFGVERMAADSLRLYYRLLLRRSHRFGAVPPRHRRAHDSDRTNSASIA
jgi:glycosyltransferase involved in cell wall biosynthesis/O-antigen/teichoic acid export membrane protein